MFLSNQKRMAAEILSRKEGKTVGIHRIWVNPDYLAAVSYTHLTLPTKA